jgi:hypothetical protein
VNGAVNSANGGGMRIFFLLFAVQFLALAAAAEPASDRPIIAMAGKVVVCPAAPGGPMPDFAAADCELTQFWRADPQGREIWLRAVIAVDPQLLAPDRPAGVFVSAKASSEVFLNGRRLGANGVPAATKSGETPGRMDAVFFAPLSLLQAGDNEVVIRMSSHHGFLRLHNPVHFIAIGDFADPTRGLLSETWPSLAPFGALVLGGLYFAAAAFSGGMRANAVLLSLMSLFAAGQLYAELYRGITSYAYPSHDWRLVVVLALSAAFGLCLAAHVIITFVRARWHYCFAAAALATFAATFLSSGFDGKTSLAVLTPTLFSLGVTVMAARRRAPQALAYAVTMLAFAATIVIFPNRFLDTIFFYELAAFLLVLFVMQARARERDRHELAGERMRARQLEDALARASAKSDDAKLRIASAGAIDLVAAADIVFCKGAGDYVELNLANGRSILHHGALTRLEEELPASFLRVHRSYLVNTRFVSGLKRDASGAGALTLTTDAEIPVSRRIMPQVRNALA